MYQNAVASFKQERISSTVGLSSRFSFQHRSTIAHSSPLNPRSAGSSGFFGLSPSMIAAVAALELSISLNGWCPHKTWSISVGCQ